MPLYIPRTDYLNTQALSAGESSVPRDVVMASVTMSSQSLRLAYFTATKTESVATVRVQTTGTAAGATPSLIRVGLYSVAANGDITLVASTANDTALLAAQNTMYSKALSAPYTKQAGQRYAVGLLVVTAAAAPTVAGAPVTLVASEVGLAPKLGGLVSSQADLPASVVSASVSDSANRPYIALVP